MDGNIQIRNLENIRNRMKFVWNNQDFTKEVDRLEIALADVEQNADWISYWTNQIQEQIRISRSLDKIFDEKFEGLDLERILGFDETKRRWQLICDDICNSIDILTELMKDEMYKQSLCETEDDDELLCNCEFDSECQCEHKGECAFECENGEECPCEYECECDCGYYDESESARCEMDCNEQSKGREVMKELKQIGTDLKDAVGTACKEFSGKLSEDAPICKETINSLKEGAKKGAKKAEKGIKNAINTGIGAFDRWRLGNDGDDDK